MDTQNDQFYLTPHKVTAVICSQDVFARSLASLTERSQIILRSGDPTTERAPQAKYVTPIAVVFCGSIPRAQVEALSAAQYQTIYVCEDACTHCGLSQDAAQSEKFAGIPNVVVTSRREIISMDIYVSGAATAAILDHIKCAEFPQEKSRFGHTHHASRAFLRAAERAQENLHDICRSFRGADKVHDLEVAAAAEERVVAEHVRCALDGQSGGKMMLPWIPLWRECADALGSEVIFYRKRFDAWEITIVESRSAQVTQVDKL